MENYLVNVKINVPDNIFIKNPETSELGKKIIIGGIEMMSNVGFENFTFKKLSVEIGTTEASIYRYFESKHKLLLYFTAWYWGWMDYRLTIGTANIDDPTKRLEKAILIVTEKVQKDSSFSHIDETQLHHIMISESTKTYLTKEVDSENKEGVFLGYKQLVARISNIITEFNPNFKYPHMLVSTCIEGAHLQRFFADHLPRLTDIEDNDKDSVTTFFKLMVLNTINS